MGRPEVRCEARLQERHVVAAAALAIARRDLACAVRDPLELGDRVDAAIEDRFRTTSGIRTAVYRGELRPVGAAPSAATCSPLPSLSALFPPERRATLLAVLGRPETVSANVAETATPVVITVEGQLGFSRSALRYSVR
jgi:hypothetical protein